MSILRIEDLEKIIKKLEEIVFKSELYKQYKRHKKVEDYRERLIEEFEKECGEGIDE